MKQLEAETGSLSKTIPDSMLRNRLLKDQLKLKLMSPGVLHVPQEPVHARRHS
jgi:hypothetical protein